MILTKIKAYQNGKWTGYEQLYVIDSHTKALNRCRKGNPEFKNCVLIAETFDSKEPKNEEYLKYCIKCGCIS